MQPAACNTIVICHSGKSDYEFIDPFARPITAIAHSTLHVTRHGSHYASRHAADETAVVVGSLQVTTTTTMMMMMLLLLLLLLLLMMMMIFMAVYITRVFREKSLSSHGNDRN